MSGALPPGECFFVPGGFCHSRGVDGGKARQKDGRKHMEEKEQGQHSFAGFCRIVEQLRSENGCPWDRAQTFESLRPCMVNEMTEAVAGIRIWQDTGDASNLCEELGDVLLQVVLLAQIAQEQGLFSIEDVVCGISQKMIRRHPHVFGSSAGEVQAQEVPGRWEEIKRAEKKNRTQEQEDRYTQAFLDASEWTARHLEQEKEKKLEKKYRKNTEQGKP